MWPWTTKSVIISTGIFVATAKNTLYESKLLIFLLCQKSCSMKIFWKFLTLNIYTYINGNLICSAFRWCISLNFEKFTLMTGFVVHGHTHARTHARTHAHTHISDLHLYIHTYKYIFIFIELFPVWHLIFYVCVYIYNPNSGNVGTFFKFE